MRSRDVFGAVSLILLVSAGEIKANPLLGWLPADLTVMAALAVVVAIVISRIADGPAGPGVFLPITVWVLLLPWLASTASSEYAQTKAATLFTITFVLALSPFYLLRSLAQLRVFLVGVVGVALFATMALVFSDSDSSSTATGVVVLAGSDTIGTARIAIAGAIVLLVSTVAPAARFRTRVLSGLAAAVLLMVALMTGSRGPALAAIVSILVVITMSPSFKKVRLRTLALVGTLVIAVVALLSRDGNTGLDRILDYLTGDSRYAGEVRQGLWDAALQGMASSPAGAGLGAFTFGNAYFIDYPHNLFLEIGYEFGWFPLVAALLLVVTSVARSLHAATGVLQSSTLALLIFGLLGALVSSDINGSRLFVVMVFVAFVVSGIGGRVNSGKRSLTGRRRATALGQTWAVK